MDQTQCPPESVAVNFETFHVGIQFNKGQVTVISVKARNIHDAISVVEAKFPFSDLRVVGVLFQD